jgi:hypothetical protein
LLSLTPEYRHIRASLCPKMLQSRELVFTSKKRKTWLILIMTYLREYGKDYSEFQTF